MASDIVVEGLAWLARLFGWVFWQVLVELLLGGTGHLVLRALGLRRPLRRQRGREDFGDGACILVGLLVWAVVAVVAFMLLRSPTGNG